MILTKDAITGNLKLTNDFETIIDGSYERVPVDSIRSWQRFIKAPTIEVDKPYLKKVIELAKEYLAAKEIRNRTWAEAVIYSTLYRLNSKRPLAERVGWNIELLGPAVGGGEIEYILTEKIDQLYKEWQYAPGKFPCANAYGFCMLLEGAFDVPMRQYGIVKENLLNGQFVDKETSSFPRISNYLSMANSGTGIDEDYLSKFVKDYARNQSPAGGATTDTYIEHWKELYLGNLNINHIVNGESPIRHLLVGLSGNGKSSIVKALYNAGNTGDYTQPVYNIHIPDNLKVDRAEIIIMGENRAPGNKLDISLNGNFRIKGEKYAYEIIDSKGGHLIEHQNAAENNEEESKNLIEFAKAIEDCDYIILVLDPETLTQISRQKFGDDIVNAVGSKLDILFRNSNHKPIAIVLSKFDEYGVSYDGERRLIRDADDKAALMKFINNPQGEWDTFRNALIKQSFSVEMRQTLYYLLEQMKGLLMRIVQSAHHNHPAINIYLTKVELDELVGIKRDFYRTGIPAFIEDFRDYAEWLFTLPDTTQVTCSAQYNTANGIELKWDNPKRAPGKYIILRKSSTDADFIEIASGKQEREDQVVNYIDRSCLPGQVYNYKIRLYVIGRESELIPLPVSTPPVSAPLRGIPRKLSETSDAMVVDLDWGPEQNKYSVEYSVWREDLLTPKRMIAEHLSGTQYTDPEVAKGQTYTYTLYSKTASGDSKSQAIIKTPKVVDWKFWVPVGILAFVVLLLVIYLLSFLLGGGN